MKYEFNWDKKGIRIRFFGEITAEDIVEAKKKFHGDPRFENQKYSIWDFSRCKRAAIRPDQLPLLLAYHVGASFTLPSHRLALVSKYRSMKKLGEKFISESKQTGSPWEIRIFTSEAEALEWGNN